MYIVKVLKRKDAAALIVAIIIAMIISQVLYMPTYDLSSRLANIGNDLGDGHFGPAWRDAYLNPAISILIQVIFLELLLRVGIFVRGKLVRKSK